MRIRAKNGRATPLATAVKTRGSRTSANFSQASLRSKITEAKIDDDLEIEMVHLIRGLLRLKLFSKVTRLLSTIDSLEVLLRKAFQAFAFK